jgi:hypothetical protein
MYQPPHFREDRIGGLMANPIPFVSMRRPPSAGRFGRISLAPTRNGGTSGPSRNASSCSRGRRPM